MHLDIFSLFSYSTDGWRPRQFAMKILYSDMIVCDVIIECCKNKLELSGVSCSFSDGNGNGNYF